MCEVVCTNIVNPIKFADKRIQTEKRQMSEGETENIAFIFVNRKHEQVVNSLDAMVVLWDAIVFLCIRLCSRWFFARQTFSLSAQKHSSTIKRHSTQHIREAHALCGKHARRAQEKWKRGKTLKENRFSVLRALNHYEFNTAVSIYLWDFMQRKEKRSKERSFHSRASETKLWQNGQTEWKRKVVRQCCINTPIQWSIEKEMGKYCLQTGRTKERKLNQRMK